MDILKSDSRGMEAGLAAERASWRAFVVVCAFLFASSAMATIVWCAAMSAMQGMPMPGGWTMSMIWMRMPGRTWPEAGASFICMWVVMMLAMMLPSLTRVLWRYYKAFNSKNETHRVWLTMLVGMGYFFVWTLFGAAVYPLGVAVAAVEMKQAVVARSIPIASGAIVLVAGGIQFASFKSHHLACCREAPRHGSVSPADVGTALRSGLNLGRHCIYCCANFTAALLAIGIMDLRAMILVAAGITLERLAPEGERVPQAIGVVLMALGLALIARVAEPA